MTLFFLLLDWIGTEEGSCMNKVVLYILFENEQIKVFIKHLLTEIKHLISNSLDKMYLRIEFYETFMMICDVYF